jgi:thioredoxin-dependent peroxiredoxin
MPNIKTKVLLTHRKPSPAGAPPARTGEGIRVPLSGRVFTDGMRAGDPVPDFELPAQDGRPVRLSEELTRGPVVLFFYPRAMTPGCTKESCHFRDLEAEFAAVGTSRLGISADPVDRQRQFSEKHGFDFPLLSDPDRAVARRYGVKRPGPLLNRRATFVIGSDGRLLAQISSEVDMARHADEALTVLRSSGD